MKNRRRSASLRSRPRPLPYQNARSGRRAIQQIQKTLEAFGAAGFGQYEDFDKGELLVQFKWRERSVVIRASAKGYAARWLQRHPYSHRMRGTKIDHEQRALRKGQTAVYSILRDWIKGQITAVEVGMLSFEGAFLGQLMLPTNETVLERVERDNVLSLPPPSAAH